MASCDLAREQLEITYNRATKPGTTESTFRDPAFMENRAMPVHRWVPWIAGFSAAFVDSVLGTYLDGRKQAVILDPFAGVGTTLIQSAIRGHHVVGFEINPYAALAAEAKLKALRVDRPTLENTIAAMRSDALTWRNGRTPNTLAPKGFRSRIPFFGERVEKQVLHALHFIEGIEDDRVRDLFRIAFGSVMVSFSNYTYEPSLSTRTGAGKPLIEDADVATSLIEKLACIRLDIEWLRSQAKVTPPGTGTVYNEDFFGGNHRLETGSVDLMITSPPYLNNYHYVRNSRPQMYWLNLIASPKDQKPLEENNFGTFWQVARDKDFVPLAFSHRELEILLDHIRGLNPEKGQYGGRGWANYATSYFNDCDRFIRVLKRILTRGGTGVIVVGNSILQGVNVPVQDLLGDIAQMRGLRLEGIHQLRHKRVGDSITESSVRGGASKVTLDESAVVVRKR